MRNYRLDISDRVLALCKQPRTAAEILDEFEGDDQRLAKFAIYNLVKRRELRNLTQGKCGFNKVGVFVIASSDAQMAEHQARRRTLAAPRVPSTGIDLARAWGLPA